MRLDSGIIFRVSDYFSNQGMKSDIDWDETGKKGLISIAENSALEEIFAAQVGYFCLRRLYGCDGYVSDNMCRIYLAKIKYYEDTFKKKFIDYNADKLA